MTNEPAATQPHVTGIAPWLSVADATRAVTFCKAAFGAEERERLDDGAGNVIVANLRIGDASSWVQADPDASPDALGGSPVRMIVTVDDPDSLFAQAVAAGASVIASVHEEQGWRVGRITDPSGRHWELAKPLTPLTPPGIDP